MSAPLLLGDGLIARAIRVDRHEVAWVRYVLEAHDGLANLHGAGDGTLTLVTTEAQVETLDALIDDLAAEIHVERV